MLKLLTIEDKIDEACDMLRCLDMAFKDLSVEERSPLETVLGIALRQLVAASVDLSKHRKPGAAGLEC